MSESRGKREKKDKHGRFAAFKKLATLKEKGSKHKYEVSEVNNVYDTIDEKEYAKQVMSRQDDWIIDDNGSGYVEDGRDIFDDDLDSESIAAAASMKKSKGEKRKKKAVSDNAGRGGNLQFMLSNMPSKKKEKVKLEDDDVLSELISELDDTNGASTSFGIKRPKIDSPYLQKKAADEYLKNFSSKPTPIKPKIVQKENKTNNIIKAEVECDANSMNKKSVEQKTSAKTDVCVPEATETEVKQVILPDSVVSEEVTKETEVMPNTHEEFQMDTSEMFNDDLDLSVIDDAEVEKSFSEIPKSEFSWESMQENVTNAIPEQKPTSYNGVYEFPTVKNEEGKPIFRFFWWDAYEDMYKHPGVVFLFGKTYSEPEGRFVSCCVAVRNIDRKIYLLPRPFHLNDKNEETDKPVALKDVYDEFNSVVADSLNLKSFMTRKVTKNYAFDDSIPTQSEYLEIRYTAKNRPVQTNTKGKTFSKIFGSHTSFLEILLLERKIKGPCWLDIIEPDSVVNPVSRCKYELTCSKPTSLIITQLEKPVPPPPMVVVAINMRTMIVESSLINDIVLLTCVAHTNYALDKPAPSPPFERHFCVISNPGDKTLPYNIHETFNKFKGTKVQKLNSERAMLNYFAMQIEKLDPDLIVGHDLEGYQTHLLAQKAVFLKLENIDRLSRLKRKFNQNVEKLQKDLFVGRLVCDLKISAKELIKARSYDLETLCQTILNIPEEQRIELDITEVPKMLSNVEDVLRLISHTMQNTAYSLKMMYELNAIPLALQITNIAGNLMSRTLMGGRSERNEFLLLHAFTEKDYIVPDKWAERKKENEESNGRNKPSYAGGMVLDPKVGFYDNLILLMDFNSLYPSIIQEYNICFTTVTGTTVDDAVLPDRSTPLGILPTEIRKLVESRRAVKTLMNAPDISNDLRMQYNIRQLALKLTANSMYGCLGFAMSRFYAQKLAALVTKQGRDILLHTKELVEGMNFEVIYGDTDSLMINTNTKEYDQVLKMGGKIKQEVNKLYRQIELDVDGVIKYLLLLKKKKYAAVTLTKSKNGEVKSEQEFKGLDIVRRDWARLAAETGKVVLSYILSDVTADERTASIIAHLSKIRDDLKEGRVPLPLLVITKLLGKNPEKYSRNVELPHVAVALRHNKKRGKPMRAGDSVAYVVCEDGSGKSATQRGYLLEEMRANESLKVDVDYYLAQQIFPVVSRLCEPIEGIDAEVIADALGLDKAAFRKVRPEKSSDSNALLTQKPKDENRFRDCEPFTFKCPSCDSEQIIKTPFTDGVSFLERCANADCRLRPLDYIVALRNQLTVVCRRYIKKYHTGKITCEDPACESDLRRVPLMFSRAYPVCPRCHRALMFRVYTERDLYMQLAFFRHLFDLSKHAVSVDSDVGDGLRALKNTMDGILKQSGYWVVNLGDLFSARHRHHSSVHSHKPGVGHKDLKMYMDEDEDDYEID